jgi:preprotein translocase subunit Sec63
VIPKPEPDPYAVLGVARTATPDEIKAAYRELVAKYHPDRHQGNPLEELAAAKLAELNRAYEILSDPERRAAYDRGQSVWPRPVDTPFAAASPAGRRRRGWMVVVGFLLLLPLLIRFGTFVVRMLARAFQLAAEGLPILRGTPAALVAVVIAVAVAILLFVRYRRRRRR